MVYSSFENEDNCTWPAHSVSLRISCGYINKDHQTLKAYVIQILYVAMMAVSSVRKIDHVSMGSVLTVLCLSCVPDKNVVLETSLLNASKASLAFKDLDTDSVFLFSQGPVHARFS